jgi:hypothetical protein
MNKENKIDRQVSVEMKKFEKWQQELQRQSNRLKKVHKRKAENLKIKDETLGDARANKKELESLTNRTIKIINVY